MNSLPDSDEENSNYWSSKPGSRRPDDEEGHRIAESNKGLGSQMYEEELLVDPYH